MLHSGRRFPTLLACLLGLACLAALVVTAPAAAGSVTDGPDDFYVGPGGNDAGSGATLDSRWETLDHALRQVRPGMTLWVLDGVYDEYTRPGWAHYAIVGSGTPDAWIRVHAYPGHRPKIVATEASGLEIAGNYVSVSGFEIEGRTFSATKNRGFGIAANGYHHLSITNNEVYGFPHAGIVMANASRVAVSHNEVHHNAFFNPNQGSGISLWQLKPHGIGNDGFGFNNYVVGNTVYANENKVPSAHRDGNLMTDGNGIIVDSANHQGFTARTLIFDNVVFDNGGRGVNVHQSANVWVAQNTLYHNSTTPNLVGYPAEINAFRSQDVLIANNILWPRPGERPSTIMESTAIEGINIVVTDRTDLRPRDVAMADPGLVNPTVDASLADFTRRPGSPTIGAGSPYCPTCTAPNVGAS